jgi:2-methylcitrate dehydratase
MDILTVSVHASKDKLDRSAQLAWNIAEVAADQTKTSPEAIDMVTNRIIDNAAVAVASLNRQPVQTARAMATAHPRRNGATVFGVSNEQLCDCEWRPGQMVPLFVN